MTKHSVLALMLGLPVWANSQQASCGNRNSRQPDWLRSAAENSRSDSVDVLDYDIWLNFRNTGSQQISGFSAVRFTPKVNNIATLDLDLLAMTIDSVKQGASTLTYQYNDTLLRVSLPTAVNPGDTSVVTVYYQGNPQQDPSGWGGFYFQGSYSYNLGVGFSVKPHTFGRAWHPCFDNFAERATYRFRILTTAANAAYCNGERVAMSTIGADSLLTEWHMNDAIPSYLASVAVSPYTHVNWRYISPITGDTTPVWLIAQPADTTNFKVSFVNVGTAIEGFETMFGPHQWNKVGYVLVPFSSGAMEHATSIAYPRATANGSLLFQTLMAHELSHHWWGDFVTTESAAEMWINEGMARYSEALFLEYLLGSASYLSEIRQNHFDVLRSAHITDSGHYALNAVPHAYTYGDHSYNKGADMAHTIRGYLGDSLFFAGLKHIQANFGQSNINSYQFRDAMTTATGVDMTNCFNDWIFSPGQPEFSVDSITTSGSAPYVDVQVFIKQRLRARTAMATNVPLTVTFIAPDWTVHEEEFVMSGALHSQVYTIPFVPALTIVNRNDRISHAVTAQERVVKNMNLVNFTQALMSITPQTVVDSSLIRVEHHWVAPDPFHVQPADMVISRERYWDVKGIISPGTAFNGRIDFSGTTTAAGWLDNELLVDIPGQPFREDSLVLLYRANTAQNWSVFPTFSVNTQGSATNKAGQINITGLIPGQYALGYRTNSVGIAESRPALAVQLYPNPAGTQVTIALDNNQTVQKVEVFTISGQLHASFYPQGSTDIPVSGLAPGTYVVRVTDATGANGSTLLNVSR
jgi:aminopeptidase N